jgi:very-short-patch-repair endonuclease
MTTQAERTITDLASRQHGLVTRAQLLGAGLGPDAVRYRVRAMRLRPVQRGVYRVGPLISPNAREMAAVLACGPEAVISHRSAAALWRLLPERDASAPVDVTVPAPDRRRRPAILIHRGPGLNADEVTTVDRVPTTVPARTVLDLAGHVGRRDLERALARAARRGLADHSELSALMERHPRRRHVGALRALLRERAGPALTRSEAEERFLALIGKARLPVPEVNAVLAGYEVDFLWRADRLVVEVDGFAFHSSRSAFETDRQRDGHLSSRGLRVMRVTWRQIVDEPEAMLVRLAHSLAAGHLAMRPGSDDSLR